MEAVDTIASQSIERIAGVWRKAAVHTSYSPLPPAEIRDRFEKMTAIAVDALRQDGPAETILPHGRVIGRGLVELNLLRPEALERTFVCLSEELSDNASPGRLGHLFAGIAGGFAEAKQAKLLAQQEAIRRAANSALQTAQSDLAASRDTLRALNLELSEQVAERGRAEEIQRDLADRLQRLHEIELAILSADSLATILDLTIEHLDTLIPAVSISITQIDVATKQSKILRNTNPAYPTGRELPITMIDALNRLGEGEVIYIADLRAIPNPSPSLAEIVELGARSLLTVPMRYGESLIGGIVIFLDHVREFTPAEKAVVLELAGSVTVAIQSRRLLEAEQTIRRRETILREVAAALTMNLNLDELLSHILNQLERVIANRSSAIFLMEDGETRVVAQRRLPSSPERLDNLLRTQPLALRAVIETARPAIISDTYASPDWLIIDEMAYIRSWMAVPLMVKGESIGVLTIDHDRPGSFTNEDLETAVTFAHQAAIAIDNARLLAQAQTHAGKLEAHVRQRTRDLEILYSLTAATIENHDMDTLLRQCVVLAEDAFNCLAAAIYLVDDETDDLHPAALSAAVDPRWGELLIGLNHKELTLRHPLRSTAPDRATGPESYSSWGLDESRTLVAITLRGRGRVLGLLVLLCPTFEFSLNFDPELLIAIAGQISAAMENIRLHQIARQAAIIEERERLAREIHDQVTQSIYSAGLFAEAARTASEIGDYNQVENRIHSTLRMTNQSLRELRSLLFELRTDSLARNGLVEALRERLQTVEHRAGIVAEVFATNVGELPVAVEETFYRVTLEALNNSLRHAHASQVDVVLMTEGSDLIMTIVDNGMGFGREATTRSGGMGLEGMQKRIGKVGGLLSISSNENGTWVTARAPLTQ